MCRSASSTDDESRRGREGWSVSRRELVIIVMGVFVLLSLSVIGFLVIGRVSNLHRIVQEVFGYGVYTPRWSDIRHVMDDPRYDLSQLRPHTYKCRPEQVEPDPLPDVTVAPSVDGPIALSIVFAGRHDDYDKDQELQQFSVLQRCQHFVDSVAYFSYLYGVRTELVLVEWNPEETGLYEAIEWPQYMLREDLVRVYQVGKAIHSMYPMQEHFPLYEHIAKNIGVRRARGEFISIAIPDSLWSAEIWAYLANTELHVNAYYRAGWRFDGVGDYDLGGFGTHEWNDRTVERKLAEMEEAFQYQPTGTGQSLYEQMREFGVSPASLGLIRFLRMRPFAPLIWDRFADSTLLTRISIPPAVSVGAEDSFAASTDMSGLDKGSCFKRRGSFWGGKRRNVVLSWNPAISKYLNTDAAGDFLMAHRLKWFEVHGLPEVPFQWATDSMSVCKMSARSFTPEITIPGVIMHQRHSRFATHHRPFPPESWQDCSQPWYDENVPFPSILEEMGPEVSQYVLPTLYSPPLHMPFYVSPLTLNRRVRTSAWAAQQKSPYNMLALGNEIEARRKLSQTKAASEQEERGIGLESSGYRSVLARNASRAYMQRAENMLPEASVRHAFYHKLDQAPFSFRYSDLECPWWLMFHPQWGHSAYNDYIRQFSPVCEVASSE